MTKTVGAFDNGSTTAGQLYVTNGGSLFATGSFDNGQPNSVASVTGTGSSITSAGLTNNGLLTVGAGASFDSSTGVFNSLSNGVLTSGNYYLAGSLTVGAPAQPTVPASTPASAISVIGANAAVTLDGAGQIATPSIIDSAGNNLLQGVNEIAGTLSFGDSSGAYHQFSFDPAGGNLTVDKGGNLNIGVNPGSSSPFGIAEFDLGYDFGISQGGNVLNNGNITIASSDPNTGSSFNILGTLTNSSSGTLTLRGSSQNVNFFSLINSGTIRVDPNSTIFAGTGLANLDANGNLTGGGTYSLGGNLQLASQINSIGKGTTITLDGPAGGIYLNVSGTVQGGSALASLAQNDGSLNLINGGYIQGSGTSSPVTLTNTGSITTNGNGGNFFQVNGDLVNAPAGTALATGSNTSTTAGVLTLADAAPSSRDVIAVTGSITNYGSVYIGKGDYLVAGYLGPDPNTGFPTGNGTYTQQAGGSTQVAGTLVAGHVDVAAGGTLTGTGVVQSSVSNEGTINPGGGLVPGDLLITGDYTQTGMLLLDFAGSNQQSWLWDSLTVDGTATLGGTLEVKFEPGFLAALGDMFPILTSMNAITTDFADLSFGTFGNDLTLKELYNEDPHGNIVGISLEVVSAGPVPDPSTLWMSGAGLLLAAGLAGRKRFAARHKIDTRD